VKAWLEIAVLVVACVAVFIGALLAIFGYLAAIGLGIGVLVGGAVWVFRAMTGL
jgi:hypothetical protein